MVARPGVGGDLVVDPGDLAVLEERQEPMPPRHQEGHRVAVSLGELDHARRGGEAVIDVVGSGQDVAAGGECRDLAGGVAEPGRHGGGVVGERGATFDGQGGVDERDAGEGGRAQPAVVVAEQRERVVQPRDLLVVADVDLVAADAGSGRQHRAWRAPRRGARPRLGPRRWPTSRGLRRAGRRGPPPRRAR